MVSDAMIQQLEDTYVELSISLSKLEYNLLHNNIETCRQMSKYTLFYGILQCSGISDIVLFFCDIEVNMCNITNYKT